MIILDKQFDELPKDVEYCTECVVSNQRPNIQFNDQGVCGACQWAWEKDHVVDWKARDQQLRDVLDRYRSKDGTPDVVVPGSGGKDSAFVAHQLKHRYGMHPLCVTFAPFDWTNIGFKNLRDFVSSGFENIICQPDGRIHRKIARIAFELKGDPFEPFGYGQKAWAFHIAHRYGIKLIMYGENGELEYSGREKYKTKPMEGPEEWDAAYFKGTGVDALVEAGLESGLFTPEEAKQETIRWYKPPPADEIVDSGIEMHWYSFYQRWTPQENYYYACTHTGFRPNPCGRSESTYTKYASIDDLLDGMHFYLAYLKFGLGRTTRDAMQDIRRGHITRDEGVRLVRRYDHEFPERDFHFFLEYTGISEELFWEVADRYRDLSNVWEKQNDEWRLTSVVS
jgi:N-acetyl sugar amidotransferase